MIVCVYVYFYGIYEIARDRTIRPCHSSYSAVYNCINSIGPPKGGSMIFVASVCMCVCMYLCVGVFLFPLFLHMEHRAIQYKSSRKVGTLQYSTVQYHR